MRERRPGPSRGRRRCLVLAALLAFAPAFLAAAPRGMDCPLALQRYSSNTVLYDLLINPATRTVLDEDAPEFSQRLPESFRSATVPNFSTIITPRSMKQLQEASLAKLDADLARVPVTPEAARARCARYDETRPALPAVLNSPALLVFTKITGFRDDASVNAATSALKAMGERLGWTLVFVDSGAVFNPEDLRRFNGVIWNNVSGDALTLSQQRALREYIERGGGFAAFHGSGGDPYYVWDWYADTLIGARFLGHPMAPQFQSARVAIDDPQDAIVSDLKSWTMTEEWYSFQSSPRLKGAHILVTLDESTYSPLAGTRDLRMGDHPIAWTRCIGNGRSFYTAIGHQPESYTEPNSVRLLERGIAWAAGLGATECRDGREVARAKGTDRMLRR